MSETPAVTDAHDEELEAYCTQLLAESPPGPRDGPGMPGTAAPEVERRVVLVSAAGIVAALPAAELVLPARSSCPADGRVIDLAAAFTGAAGRAGATSRWFALRRWPGDHLRVDAETDTATWQEGEVRWRDCRATRPWLMGIIDTMGAVLIDIAGLPGLE